MKLFRSIIIILLFPTLLFSQKSINKEDVRQIIIPMADSTIKAGILVKQKLIKANNELEYFWYKSNKIFKNRGGFDGNLLHGNYQVFNSTGELLQNGEFKKGLRTGTWKLWYKNGEIYSITKWYKGRLNGQSTYFSSNGQIIKSVNYKNDTFHKKTKIYNSKGEIKEIHFYKSGTLKLNFINKMYIRLSTQKENPIIFKPELLKKEKKVVKPKNEKIIKE